MREPEDKYVCGRVSEPEVLGNAESEFSSSIGGKMASGKVRPASSNLMMQMMKPEDDDHDGAGDGESLCSREFESIAE